MPPPPTIQTHTLPLPLPHGNHPLLIGLNLTLTVQLQMMKWELADVSVMLLVHGLKASHNTLGKEMLSSHNSGLLYWV